jgi:O-acetyl-ADP-ribose deacetylase (regulator of RNase III)
MAQIQYLKGDIFDSRAQVIVNTVNCQGVMGKGLALAFKERFPDMFLVYQQDCKAGRLRIGKTTIYKKSTPWILNFPTKNHWRYPSKLEYLEKGLEFLVAHYKKVGITSIAFPKLGAQNGKLSWDAVGPLMAKYLSQLDIDVYIYIAEGDREYQHDPILDNQVKERAWKEFNDLALSIDRLCQEIGLSSREANKIAKQREAKEFTSQADIDSVENLAKISSKKIKAYINQQLLTNAELPGLPGKKSSGTKTNKRSAKTAKRAKKKSDTDVTIHQEWTLPLEMELTI